MAQKSIAVAARRVRWFAIIVLVLMAGAFVVARFGLDLGPGLEVARRDHGTDPRAAVAADVAILLFLVALAQLIRLLGRLGAGELFAPAVTGAFRTFAFWLLLSAAAAIAGPLLVGAAGAGEAQRIELPISVRDVMFLIAGIVMFLIARMLDEAARIAAELDEIV